MSPNAKKIITGFALALFGVGVIAIGPLLASLVLAGVVIQALREFYSMAERKGFKPLPWYGVILSLGFIASAVYLVTVGRYDVAPVSVGIVVSLGIIWVLIIQLYCAARSRQAPALEDLAVSLFGSIYIGGLLSYTLLLWGLGIEAFPEDQFKSGLVLFLGMWGAYGTDAGAYLVGKAFGKTKLLPQVSPNKTWEGAAGGVLVGTIGTLLVATPLGIPFFHAMFLGFLMGTMGMLGDLCESMVKRETKIKDSSGLLGTHGGVLDRMDSLIFAVPTAYFYLLLLRPWA